MILPRPFRTTDKVPIFERSSAASICFGFKEMGGVGSRRLLSLSFFMFCLTSMGYHISQLFMVPTNRCFLVVFITRRRKGLFRKGETGREGKGRGKRDWGKGKGKKALGLGPGFATPAFLHFTTTPTTAYRLLPTFKKVYSWPSHCPYMN